MAKSATSITKKKNDAVYNELPFKDTQSFTDACKNKIAPLPKEVISSQQRGVVWDPEKFDFIKEGASAPDTVNPSLWRQSELVNISGLFKVTDSIYQVRNYDLSNITIIETASGIIIADTLISSETARAALDLYYEHRPHNPIIAIIYSHSHADHFGGVRGLIHERDIQERQVKIIAPQGFVAEAVAENIMAGNAMGRRASYMYGNLLPANSQGQVGAGLGMTTSTGSVGLIEPTDIITPTNNELHIDGLTFQFLLTPDSEAPAEMHWYIPELKAVTAAENVSHTLHNTYSLRGAKIRDPLAWSKYINETLKLWGDKAEVLYGMHHWPVWGNKTVKHHLRQQRDLYRFINDQTLRLANQGFNATEIAEQIELPTSLGHYWANRGYYGTLNHNVKSTYVKYLGWFDGNPATLHELPRIEAGKKYVACIGGIEETIKKADEAFSNGDYRWVVELLNHAIYAHPENKDAKELQADALEQLGYQAESGPWRNFYLSGAQELREGIKDLPATQIVSPDIIRALQPDLLFDYVATRINSSRADDKKLTLNFIFTDLNQEYLVTLEHSVLNNTQGIQSKSADATIKVDKLTLANIFLEQISLADAQKDKRITIAGDGKKLNELMSMLDTFAFWFPLVTPVK